MGISESASAVGGCIIKRHGEQNASEMTHGPALGGTGRQPVDTQATRRPTLASHRNVTTRLVRPAEYHPKPPCRTCHHSLRLWL